jgi:hypothetical protein
MNSKIWNLASWRQKTYAPRTTKMHGPVGKPMPFLAGQDTCFGCGYHECGCERLRAPKPSEQFKRVGSTDLCCRCWLRSPHCKCEPVFFFASPSQIGKQITAMGGDPPLSIILETRYGKLEVVADPYIPKGKEMILGGKLHRSPADCMARCVFCDGTGTHECPGGTARALKADDHCFSMSGRPIDVFPGKVDANAFSSHEWERL